MQQILEDFQHWLISQGLNPGTARSNKSRVSVSIIGSKSFDGWQYHSGKSFTHELSSAQVSKIPEETIQGIITDVKELVKSNVKPGDSLAWKDNLTALDHFYDFLIDRLPIYPKTISDSYIFNKIIDLRKNHGALSTDIELQKLINNLINKLEQPLFRQLASNTIICRGPLRYFDLLDQIKIYLVDRSLSGKHIANPRFSGEYIRVPFDSHSSSFERQLQIMQKKFEATDALQKIKIWACNHESQNHNVMLPLPPDDIFKTLSETCPQPDETSCRVHVLIDLLACYVPFKHDVDVNNAAIFLWVDKLEENYPHTSYKDLTGFAADVLIHELGHFLLDTCTGHSLMPQLLTHMIEEPLANGLAIELSSPAYSDFALIQPFPYPYGLAFAARPRHLKHSFRAWRKLKSTALPIKQSPSKLFVKLVIGRP